MNIVLDNIIFALQRAGGVSVYWYELLRRLARDNQLLKVIERPESASNIFRRKLDLDPASLRMEKGRLPLRLARYFPYPAGRDDKILYHSSYYRRPQTDGAVNIVTVYDFTYERFRRGLPRRLHSLQKRTALRAAHGVICISESTKRDLLWFCPGMPEDKIQVIHLGVPDEYKPLAPGDRHSLPPGMPAGPFLLFVGVRDPYKNFHLALESVAALPDYWLVSVGGGELQSEEAALAQKLLPGRHLHLSLLGSERLNLLYNCAHALLYPSSYEGFGIPVLEAMAAGCPVIAANTSSIPEVAGKAGLLVDEVSAEAFAARIQSLENASLRASVIQEGLVNAGRFSWDRCYQETVAFYQKVHPGIRAD